MTIDPSSRPSRLPHAALVTYAIALVVGTLYPMAGWRSSGLPLFGFLLDPWPRWWTWFDIVFNIVVYLPGGLLLAMVLRESRWARFAVLLTVLIGSAAAVSLEALQSLLPNRVPSRLDWLANTAGAWLGALLSPLGARLAGTLARVMIDVLEGASIAALPQRWARFDVLAGDEVAILFDGVTVQTGTAAGIDEDGALRLLDNGVEHRVCAGEVSVRRRDSLPVAP